MAAPDYDVLVVGSGFGGAVSALRLAEKGYRVGVLEAGRRFADGDFPATSWQFRDYLWAPWARCFGIFRVNPLRDVLVLSGAGVGGGSLVYANTLYRPGRAFYDDPQWRDITDWADELDLPYDQATRMLGATTYPRVSPSDEVMRDVAEEMGVGHTFGHADVGVFFGAGRAGEQPGEEVPDPYFGGAGPARHGCLHCGECMTGCRHDAKNTLVKNYLHLAEAAGVRVHPLTTVTRIRPRGRRPVRRLRLRGRRAAHRASRRPAHAARRPGRRRGVGAGQPAAAAPDAAPGRPAARLPAARRALPHQLRGHPRRARPARRRRLHARGLDHLVDPPRPAHPRRAGALRARVEPAGAALGGARRRHDGDGRPHARRARPVVAPDRGRGAALAADPARPAPPAALGGAVDRAAGDAVAGQLADAAAAAPVPGPDAPARAPGRRTPRGSRPATTSPGASPAGSAASPSARARRWSTCR